MSKQINVALIGNPNTGKTSVFNALTGLNQKVGNYPGITVDKKQGVCKLSRGVKAHIIDLPGTYSINASSMDENVVVELLLNKNDKARERLWPCERLNSFPLQPCKPSQKPKDTQVQSSNKRRTNFLKGFYFSTSFPFCLWVFIYSYNFSVV